MVSKWNVESTLASEHRICLLDVLSVIPEMTYFRPFKLTLMYGMLHSNLKRTNNDINIRFIFMGFLCKYSLLSRSSRSLARCRAKSSASNLTQGRRNRDNFTLDLRWDCDHRRRSDKKSPWGRVREVARGNNVRFPCTQYLLEADKTSFISLSLSRLMGYLYHWSQYLDNSLQDMDLTIFRLCTIILLWAQGIFIQFTRFILW